MITDRLYIDGVLVDTPKSGLSITLNYKGNILDGLKGISANYTNTIRLPRTQRNLDALHLPQMVSNTTAFPYHFHTAKYECEGVEIIKDGRAVVMGCTESSIELTIIWSAGAAFDLLCSETRLSDLNEAGNTLLDYVSYISLWSNTTDTPTCFHDSNEDNNKDSLVSPVSQISDSPLFCSCKVNHILNLIQNQFGVSFNFQSASPLDSAAVLCSGGKLAGNSGTLTFTLPASGRGDTNIVVQSLYNQNTTPNTKVYYKTTIFGDLELWGLKTIQSIIYFYVPPEGGNTDQSGFTPNLDIDASIDIYITFTPYSQSNDIVLNVLDESGGIVAGFTAPLTNIGTYKNLSVQSTISLKAGKKYFFRLTGAYSFDFESHSYIDVSVTNNAQPSVGLYYNRVGSLPDVKMIDFVSTLAAISGTFPVAKYDNEIWFYTYASLLSDTPIDWSKKLASYDVSYKASGWAQSNVLQWAETDASGSVSVDDETIEVTRDWYKSQMNIGENSFYPYFERKALSLVDTDGSSYDAQIWTYTKPKPCIHLIKKTTDAFANKEVQAVDFAGLDFSTLVTTYYPALSSIMNHPKIVDVAVRMNAAEIVDLDMSKTYYFEQLGHKFAILQIQYSKGIAKCKMLKI